MPAKKVKARTEKAVATGTDTVNVSIRWMAWIVLPLLAVLLAAAVKFDFDLGNLTESVLGNKSVQRTSLNFERKEPVVHLMPANESSRFQVHSADEIDHVELLGGPPLSEQDQRPMGARFRSFLNRDLTMWWDDGSERGVYSGTLKAMKMTATNTYTTHVFHFRDKDTDELVISLKMQDDRHLMFLGPDPSDSATLESEEYLKALDEQKFMAEYYAKTGRPWLSHYPPTLPVLSFWPTDFVGQVHKVTSFVGYFTSEEEQSSEPVELEIKVVSTHPKVLVIENLLSEFEVEHIISLGLNVVKRSSVGNNDDSFQSDTRTSENGWLSRKRTHILDTIYYRFSDALLQPDHQMQEGYNGNLEQLQFVQYKVGQKYDPHHDFGNTGRPNQRFSTLFIYLRVPEGGGATSFPKAIPAGIKVKPPAGSAALFYSMDEEGNGDDLSLHSGMVVDQGTKLACNLWSWTPSVGAF